MLALVAVVVAFAPFPFASSLPSASRAFVIEARQFSYSPSELKVNPGDTVTIQLVSTDVVHGLYIDEYDLSVEADPGQTVSLTFVADKPGSFRFRCNVTCGAMHPFMTGKLTVGRNDRLYRSIALTILAAVGVVPLSSFLSKRKTKEEIIGV